jgi:hypothetical protein
MTKRPISRRLKQKFSVVRRESEKVNKMSEIQGLLVIAKYTIHEILEMIG